jgi:hypothetical protein
VSNFNKQNHPSRQSPESRTDAFQSLKIQAPRSLYGIWILVAFLWGQFQAIGQTSFHEEPEEKVSQPGITPIKIKHHDLEAELELYPFNLVVPKDPIIKTEAMFDYHWFNNNDRMLGGVRFFADENTHWKDKRDMRDLIMYTEVYYGTKNFQLGVETGTITGEEFISVGPQFTNYDNHIFKRVSIITRLFPDCVLGYEFTTHEATLFRNVKISSTGMGRITIPSNQAVIQYSAWLSFEGLKGIFIGLEYEHNNAKYFNNLRYETNNELFFGIKAELH